MFGHNPLTNHSLLECNSVRSTGSEPIDREERGWGAGKIKKKDRNEQCEIIVNRGLFSIISPDL